MRLLKSGLIILALIAFLIGAYFITNSGRASSTLAENSSNIKASSLGELLNTTSSLNQKSDSPVFDTNDKNNLTKALGDNLFEQIEEQNAANPDFFSSTSSVNDTAQKIVENSLNNSSLNLNQPVKETDLKISQDNSKTAKLKYFQNLDEISINRFNDPSHKITPQQTTDNVIADCSVNVSALDKELANFYPSVVKDYLNVAVPSDFINLHEKIIMHFNNAALIYQALTNCFQDPIKGYIAAQALPSLAEETITIQAALGEKYKEITLEK